MVRGNLEAAGPENEDIRCQKSEKEVMVIERHVQWHGYDMMQKRKRSATGERGRAAYSIGGRHDSLGLHD